MTKQLYFEMCEELGQEPIEEEIPVDFEDFPEIVLHCIYIYSMLDDRWDTMNGSYLGKNFGIVFSLFDLYKIIEEEKLISLEFIQHIDSVRSKLINDKVANKTQPTKPRK